MRYRVEREHTFGGGNGTAPPPVLFEREVADIESVRDLVFAGILYDCEFFRDCGYTSDDDCVSKDDVHTRALRLSQEVVDALLQDRDAAVRSQTSPHNYYTWRVTRVVEV